jgi:hypothetical protein
MSAPYRYALVSGRSATAAFAILSMVQCLTPPPPPPPPPPEVDHPSEMTHQAQDSGAGAERDPEDRAIALYRAQLANWFVADFQIRGKIPFEKLKTLRAATVLTLTGDRLVSSFSLVKPSGDPTFDAEVQATLMRIQSRAAPLPAPPPTYPDLLRQTLCVEFQCTVQKFCE